MLAVGSCMALPAFAEAVDLEAFAGVPRVSAAVDGSVMSWRTLGMRVATDWLDVEVSAPTCLGVAVPAAPIDADRVGPRGGASAGGAYAPMAGAHRASLTLKLPRPSAELPFVDVTIQRWRSLAVDRSDSAAASGATWSVVATQPVGSVDATIGYELPMAGSRPFDRWRTVFTRVSWHPAPGIAAEIGAERSVEHDSAAIDRALVVRFARRVEAGGARIAASGVRSFDDASRGWRFNVALEIPY